MKKNTSIIALSIIVCASGCGNKDSSEKNDEQVKSKSEEVGPKQETPLLVAMRKLVRVCDVDLEAATMRCPDGQGVLTNDALRTAKQGAVDIVVQALSDVDPKIRLVATQELNNMYVSSTRVDPAKTSAASAKALRESFPKFSLGLQRNMLQFTIAASMPHAEAETRALLGTLKDEELVARGWAAALSHARLGDFERVKTIAESSSDPSISNTILSGISHLGVLSEDQSKVVCPWATSQLKRDPKGGDAQPLFSTAALVVKYCPGGDDLILSVGEKAASEHQTTKAHLLSIDDCEASLLEVLGKPTASKCKRWRSLGETAASDEKLPIEVRGYALEKLARTFPDEATKKLVAESVQQLPKAAAKALKTLSSATKAD